MTDDLPEWFLAEPRSDVLAGTLEFDDGTEASIPVASNGPATQGRIMMAFAVPDGIPAARKVTAARIRAEETGHVFAPHLSIPPGRTLTVSFTVADAQAFDPEAWSDHD